MRILFLSELPLPSDSAHAVFTLKMAGAYACLGASVRVLHPSESPGTRSTPEVRSGATPAAAAESWVTRFDLDGLPTLHALPRGRAYSRLAPIVAAAMRPDLVVTTDPPMAARAARLGCDVVLDLHALLGPASPRALASLRRLVVHPRLRALVTCSDRLRVLQDAIVPLPAARTRAMHNGVSRAQLASREERTAARQRLGLDPARPTVIHAGHLYPGRGGEELVEVAARIPAASFVFVGGRAPDIEALRRIVERRAIGNVRFVGHVAPREVPGFLAASDIVVMPYTTRTVASDGKLATIEYASPMKMPDAMAAERAIVSTRFAGISEVLRHEENALLVPPDDPAALASAIERLIDEPLLASRLARTARLEVATRTWVHRAHAILTLAGAVPSRLPSP